MLTLRRRIVPFAVLIALMASVSSAVAHEPERIPESHLGPQGAGLPPDYIFYVDETDGNGGGTGDGGFVVDGLYDDSDTFKALMSKGGSPSNVVCGVASREVAEGSRWPQFEFSSVSIKDSDRLPHGQTYAAPCTVTAKVTLTKRIAHLLGLRKNSFEVTTSPGLVMPMFNRWDQNHDSYGFLPRGSHFHFTLPRGVRAKFARVQAVKGLTISGSVVGPESYGSPVVKVKTVRDGQWLGRLGGNSCAAASGHLQIRPVKGRKPCPRGFQLWH
jgi:hypothetical protein